MYEDSPLVSDPDGLDGNVVGPIVARLAVRSPVQERDDLFVAYPVEVDVREVILTYRGGNHVRL
jgi:hypothetical protein